MGYIKFDVYIAGSIQRPRTFGGLGAMAVYFKSVPVSAGVLQEG